MTVTYNSGSNTITVTGYTSGTPCNFTDIYNADVAGGWGDGDNKLIRKETWKIKVSVDTAATKAAFEKPGSSHDAKRAVIYYVEE